MRANVLCTNPVTLTNNVMACWVQRHICATFVARMTDKPLKHQHGQRIRCRDDRTSMTATPVQIPRITPQFSRNHFSTLVTQPWGGGRQWVGGPCAGGRRIAPWSKADTERAVSKHSLLSLDWVSEGKNNRARLSWGNLQSGLSETCSPNSRTIALSLLFAKNMLKEIQKSRCEEIWVWLNDKVWNFKLRVAPLRDAGASVEMRAWRTVSYTGRSVDRCSHRPTGLMSEPGRDSLRQEQGYRFRELFLIMRLSDQFPGPVQPQHFIWRRRVLSCSARWQRKRRVGSKAFHLKLRRKAKLQELVFKNTLI